MHRKQRHISPVSHNLLREVGLDIAHDFAVLKKAYPNSVIFLDTIGKHTKLPWRTKKKIGKVLHQLENHGLLRFEQNRAILLSRKSQEAIYRTKNKKNNHYIKIENNEDIRLKLSSEAIASKLRQTAFVKACFVSQQSPIALKALKKYPKGFLHNYNTLRGQQIALTSSALAKLLKTSLSKARRLLVELANKHYITRTIRQRSALLKTRFTFEQYKEIRKNWKDFILDNKITSKPMKKYCFWYKGLIMHNPPVQVGIIRG